ncbi:hypothetical protein EYZ11_000404 [Aspergillus tanneri]|uniref:SRR1-like domain-containing protein n=1 Tax=Aspergillus tanneri TaxID=1220188 RepID=A0A4S3JX37_9EURO|nr:hypothetical protein EYZ11_000404 [Aspergillus tanneri]
MTEEKSQVVSLEDEIDHETLGKIQDRLAHIMRLWQSGKPFFPRALLEDLNRQIDAGHDEVHIQDLDEVPQTYSLKVPACIQYLGHLAPICPELALRHDHTPVSIGYTRAPPLSTCTLDEVRVRFSQTRHLWMESTTRRDLEHHLSTLTLSVPVNKIVCFALGSLASRSDSHPSGSSDEDWHVTRAHAQHAAIESMVSVLSARGMVQSEGVRCFAQDPAYDAVDKEFLREIGIVVLEDPKGFLEVDSNTLVFSVSPNVPVKQIVADLQWPAAMVWNTVSLAEKEDKTWVRNVKKNGEVYWTSPFTTDPDCARVGNMVKGYARATLSDADELFGDMTIYTK